MSVFPDDRLKCVRVMLMSTYFDSPDYPPFYCPCCCRNIYYSLLFEHKHFLPCCMTDECRTLFGIELDDPEGRWVICQECALKKITFINCEDAADESRELIGLKNMCIASTGIDDDSSFITIFCRRRVPRIITKSARNIKE